MENWNQDHPERYSNFCGLYIKFQGCGLWPSDQMQCPALPLQWHWGLRVLPSSLPLHTLPLRVAPSHLSCTCHFLTFHKYSKYFFNFSIFFLSWSPNSSNSSTSSFSLIPWIYLMPPSLRQSFRNRPGEVDGKVRVNGLNSPVMENGGKHV